MSNVDATTWNSLYLPFTKKLGPRLDAGTVVVTLPARVVPPDKTIENPPPSQPAAVAACNGTKSGVDRVAKDPIARAMPIPAAMRVRLRICWAPSCADVDHWRNGNARVFR